MKACGTWGWWNSDTGETRPFYCGHATCWRQQCRRLFWAHRVRLVSDLIAEHGLTRFFTLTLSRGLNGRLSAWDYIPHPWSKLRKRLRRRCPGFKFVAVLESHKDRAWPHIHGFTNEWIPQRDWSQMWEASGGGRVVWVEAVKTAEASEYVSKQLEVARYVGKENLLEAYKLRGSHRTLWRSKGLKAAFELTSEPIWCILKENVYNGRGQMTDYWSKKGVWHYGQDEQQRQDVEATRSALLTASTQDRIAHMEAQGQAD